MPTKPYKKMKMNVHDDDDHLLPLSLIESEILPRLTAKSVGCCRCVCKQWKSFLSTPSFARTNVANNDYKLLLLEYQGNLRTLPDNFLHTKPADSNNVLILASLDGLVCLAIGSQAGDALSKLAFWNPLTGAYRNLHDPEFLFYSYFSLHVVGFYKDSCNDYKLVCVVSTKGNKLHEYEAHVYSNRLDTWRKIEFSIGVELSSTWSPATFNDQCLYFTVVDKFESRHSSWVICFDVETETFRRINFPTDHVRVAAAGCPDGSSLVVLNGCVHLCVSYTDYKVVKQGNRWRAGLWKQGERWKMDGDAGWVKVGDFTSRPLDKEFTMQRICITSNGNWVIIVDEENNSLKKLDTEDFTRQYRYFCSSRWEYGSSRVIYVESLVSPNNP
ncbi:hypothetical protein QVD17_31584 [Tagetes erecta]|uniref:F-box domain-containing protein n=1 Tax=Tagetes erecta TaxID=13708 RepID=A0AAD8K7W5_TARER|nr:hypothetical protein QVD17_31584 [Tagetes erecta]